MEGSELFDLGLPLVAFHTTLELSHSPNGIFFNSMTALTNVRPLKTRLKETVERIIKSGRITRADEDLLFQAATSDQVLTPEEMKLVQRVFDRLQMNMLKLSD